MGSSADERITLGSALLLLLGSALAGCGQTGTLADEDGSPDRQTPDPGLRSSPADFSAVARELFSDPGAWEPGYWQAKPALQDFISYSLTPSLTDDGRQAVRRMKAGEFRPSAHFDWLPLGIPPPWDDNPLNNNTWDLYRHSLTWIQPLVVAGLSEGDSESLELAQQVLRNWRARNEKSPGASEFAWDDHATAKRLHLLCWFWEVYRRSEVFEEGFASELLNLIHAHAEFVASGAAYRARSNHGLAQNVALLTAVVAIPEFREAEDWRRIVYDRTTAYVRENFSAEGFHLEQSPSYHQLVLRHMGAIVRFLAATGNPPIPGVGETARRAAALWPYLVRPDGRIANIGDSSEGRWQDYAAFCTRWWGEQSARPAESTLPNPRQDVGEFLLDFEAGYGVFTAYPIGQPQAEPDTYVLFKCNAFRYSHFHPDALSFIVYGLGRDWLIDAGVYSYAEEVPERKYVRSSRAHNVVLIDDADFKLGRIELIDFGRTETGDFVTVRHYLRQATHTRTLAFVPPRTINIRDELTSADGQPHTYTQLFHLAVGLEPRILSERVAHAVAEDRKVCEIEQTGGTSGWCVIVGQKEPYWQGWYSPGFRQIEPAPVLVYSSAPAQLNCAFVTRIRLIDRAP